MKLLAEAVRLIEEKGYEIGNVDATVIAQRPKLLNYIPTMKENISKDPQSRSRSGECQSNDRRTFRIHRRGTWDQCTGSVSAE